MKYKIVLDSCGELPEEYKNDQRFERVPLELQVGDYRIWDDETFDQKDFLERVAKCPVCPKSACPSPERYMRSFDCGAEHVYVVTLSGNLSGSYNSAVLARSMYLEEHPDVKIHVIDSCSASCGETQIGFYIMQLEEEGVSFEDICQKADAYRDDMDTYFILDNLETLRKNGRLSLMKAFAASTLSIKPLMNATPAGEIQQISQAIGMKKAMVKLAELIKKDKPDAKERSLMITHCNAPEKAEKMRQLLEEKMGYKSVVVMDMAGISSMYANDGGFIITI